LPNRSGDAVVPIPPFMPVEDRLDPGFEVSILGVAPVNQDTQTPLS
jgi:hypothetical protein